MTKIGILGGTFDPPHYGHLLIANEVLSELNLDEIWFMPNQEPPHKKKSDSVENADRLQMLELAIEGNPAFKIEKIELERSGPSLYCRYDEDIKRAIPRPSILFYHWRRYDRISAEMA